MTDYNSVQNYERLFLDIIGEVGDDDCTDDKINNILAGFEAAIINNMGYHDDALKRLRKLHGAFMRGDFQRENLLD